MADSSQKFIARNRAPRVQIEYDVEVYGAEKKIQLPFVMGVMSDLAGKSEAPQPAVADRKFLEIDVDNFDDRMKSMKPRAAFTVPNTLTGEGNLAVDITFESMDDFSPAAIARKVEPLRKLLEARTQLSNLMTYMDGKTGAENLIGQIIQDPALLKALAAAPATADADHAAALAAVRQAPPTTATDQSAAERATFALESLRGIAPETGAADQIEPDSATASALEALRGAAQGDVAAVDAAATTLDALRASAPNVIKAEDETALTLDTLRRSASEAAPVGDNAAAALQGLRASAPDQVAAEDEASRAFDALRRAATTEAEPSGAPAAALEALRAVAPQDQQSEDATASSLDALRQAASEAAPVEDTATAVLEGLRVSAAAPDKAEDDLAAALDALREPAPHAIADGTSDSARGSAQEAEDVDALLGSLDEQGTPERATAETAGPGPGADDLDGLLGSLDAVEANDAATDSPPAEPDAASGGDDDLDALLGSLDADEVDPVPADTAIGSGDRHEDAGALLGAAPDAASDGVDNDLDALLGSLDPDEAGSAEIDEALTPSAPGDDLAAEDLDALLGSPDGTESAEDGAGDLDAPLESDRAAQAGDDLDAMLADLAGPGAGGLSAAPAEQPAAGGSASGGRRDSGPGATPFGVLSAPRPAGAGLPRDGFRMAIFGDFSGRSARGLLETGDALANRRAIRLDVDTVDRVIEGFATTIVLPMGRDGAGVEVTLGELDDLHPDELYENVAVFAELSGLRQRLKSGSLAPAAVAQLQGWGAEFGALDLGQRAAARGVAVPADRALSDFQALIGDVEGRLAQASPAADLIARIVAPHVVAAPSAETPAMIAAVDAALSEAMRLILHSPEFQSVEAQWRSLDLLARRIETDADVGLVLYDVSAEELAVDLAAQDDLAECGFLRLLTEGPMVDDGRGGFSAMFGLYTFEETPPHAELLARIAKVAAHVGAPFFTGISPEFLKTRKRDRHPLVARSWDALRALPEARYLGIASPRFLLRRPYGARSEPIDAFAFEEFTMREGLRGMLWANPAVLAAILLASSRKRGGAVDLGSVMSIDDMPFHFMTDEHGDQVALPCTERNLTTAKVEEVVTRGFMPVLSIRGRDEVRLGSFQALGGGTIRGPWDGGGEVSAPASPPRSAPDLELVIEREENVPDVVEEGASNEAAGGEADDLDALLASFGDDAPGADPSDIDAELAALLEDL